MKFKLLLSAFVLIVSLFAGILPVALDEAQITEDENIKSITISCAGDCTLGADDFSFGITLPNEVLGQNCDYGWFFRNVLPIFVKDDLTIVNFEGTLTTRGLRKDKEYAFRGNPEYVNILTEGGVDAVTLANNHSLDYGDISLSDTKELLDDAGILWAENENVCVREIDGIKVGLIGLDDLTRSAVNVLPKAMETVKKDGADIIVVNVHWGIEKESVPTARQRQIAHSAIDMGADMVMGHHPHVVQGLEMYKGKIIAYSLGNFCFGGNQNPSDMDSMIFQQTFFVKNAELLPDTTWQIYPCSISSVTDRNNYQPTPVFGKKAESIKKKITKRTASVGNLDVIFAEEY